MRKASILISVFGLALSAQAQTPRAAEALNPGDVAARSVDPVDRQFDFAGGAVLSISRDSMTDRQVCTVRTPNSYGAWILASDGTAILGTAFNVDADYTQPAFLRIGEAAKFDLIFNRRRHVVNIPLAKMADVVRALYTQQRVRVRFTEYPSGALFDRELQLGDFAAAYDRGVELCGWKKMDVAAVHPAPELSPDNSASAPASHSVSVSAPGCIYCPAPSYSIEAVGASPIGSVLLRVTVGSDGRAADVSVVNDAEIGLTDKIVEAVRAWRFTPPKSGEARSRTVEIKFQ